MAARLVWSQETLDDIEAMADRIHRNSSSPARRIAEWLFDLAETLAKLGRMAEERSASFE